MSRLASDPVFSALTRPQTIGGVTYTYAVLNLIVTAEAFLITRSFWSLLIAVALHAIGYVGSLRELNLQGGERRRGLGQVRCVHSARLEGSLIALQ